MCLRHLDFLLPHLRSKFSLASFRHSQLPTCALCSPLADRYLCSATIVHLDTVRSSLKVQSLVPGSRVGGEASW